MQDNDLLEWQAKHLRHEFLMVYQRGREIPRTQLL